MKKESLIFINERGIFKISKTRFRRKNMCYALKDLTSLAGCNQRSEI